MLSISGTVEAMDEYYHVLPQLKEKGLEKKKKKRCALNHGEF